MNLGDIFFKAALSIIAGSCLLALLIAILLRYLKKIRWSVSLGAAVLIAPVLSCTGLFFGQHPLFVAWHHSQNTALPQSGCLSYEPSWSRLLASYRMSRSEFDDWVNHHPWNSPPWNLAPHDGSTISFQDMESLGIEKPDVFYATEQAPNGKQLRLYFVKDTMYVSYNSM